MKRLLLAAGLACALPAISSPVLDKQTAVEVLESKVYSLEYRTRQLECALTEQSFEIAALRKDLAKLAKH